MATCLCRGFMLGHLERALVFMGALSSSMAIYTVWDFLGLLWPEEHVVCD